MKMTELSMTFVGRVASFSMYIIGKWSAPGVDDSEVLATTLSAVPQNSNGMVVLQYNCARGGRWLRQFWRRRSEWKQIWS
jgi:hypothetical protein